MESATKIVKTDFTLKVNETSSWVVFIAKTCEATEMLHQIAEIQRKMLEPLGWYCHVSTARVDKDCRVPEFFHDSDYWMTAIEHNNGDWNIGSTYTLYLVG